MHKPAKLVRSNAKAPTSQEQANTLLPYTNMCAFSGKLGEDPQVTDINGYQVVKFSLAHWQPKGKPTMWLKVYCYDEELQNIATRLKKGQSIIIVGKFAYDIHNDIAQLGVLANEIHTSPVSLVTKKEGK